MLMTGEYTVIDTFLSYSFLIYLFIHFVFDSMLLLLLHHCKSVMLFNRMPKFFFYYSIIVSSLKH